MSPWLRRESAAARGVGRGAWVVTVWPRAGLNLLTLLYVITRLTYLLGLLTYSALLTTRLTHVRGFTYLLVALT